MGCNCDQSSPCRGAGAGDSSTPQALITAEVDAVETVQPGAAGQGQQWVLQKPGAFTPGTVRAGQA
jgi:hypothetical protein